MWLFSTETWLILGTLCILLWYYISVKHRVLKDLNIPHDPPGFLGLKGIYKLITDVDVLFKSDLDSKKKHGSVYGSYTFTSPSITIHDLEMLKQIHIKEFAAFPIRSKEFTETQGEVMKNVLTAVTGKQWTRCRQVMTPMFSAAKLRHMLPLMDRCSEKLVENMREKSESDGKFDAQDIISRYTMDAMCATTFSTDSNAQDLNSGEDTTIVKRTKEALSINPFTSPIVLSVLIFPWLEPYVAKLGGQFWPREFIDYYCKLTDSVMEQKASAPSDHRTDLMQLMLDNEITDEQAKTVDKGITRKEIVANSIIFIIAGFENSKMLLTFLCYNLATSPECQNRLRKEIQDGIAAHDGKLNYDSLNEMKYLTQCVNETLRLQTPVIINQRTSQKDIEINGVFIPKNTKVIIPVWALGHSEDIWEEPMTFNPDRFEDMSSVNPMTFLPWGAGPRNCIGMRFAYMMVKIAIARILLGGEIQPTEGTPPPPLQLTLKKRGMKPKDDLFLKITPLPTATTSSE